MRSLLAALAISVLSAPAAHADSDGYYCTGPGYLAVEFRSFNTPGLSGPHVLKIARFDTVHGPRWAGEVILEDFQPHLLQCRAEGVTIAGWGTGFVSYEVALDANRVPRIRGRVADAARKFSPLGPPLVNLGDWARAGVTPIPAPSERHRFQVHVTRTTRPYDQGLEHRIMTELREVDTSGKVVRSLVLYRGRFNEPVH